MSRVPGVVGVPSKNDVLLRALREVPKSGEVWTEGARCHLNPLMVKSFRLGDAQKFLSFAIQFTPQYGDSFLEVLRVEILAQVFLPKLLGLLGIPLGPFLHNFLSFDVAGDVTWLAASPRAHFALTLVNAVYPLTADMDIEAIYPVIQVPALERERRARVGILCGIENMELNLHVYRADFRRIYQKNLMRRCVNADPNYGTIWHFCRNWIHDAPVVVLKAALDKIIPEMIASDKIYFRALSHYVYDCLVCMKNNPSDFEISASKKASESRFNTNYEMDLDGAIDELLGNTVLGEESDIKVFLDNIHGSEEIQLKRMVELIEDFDMMAAQRMPEKPDATYDQILNKNLSMAAVNGHLFTNYDFVSCLMNVNRLSCDRDLKAERKRKVIYGTDQIV
jgi:hypothetical protein